MGISRDTFDDSKRYLKVIKFQGTPGVDSEFNEAQDILRNELRRTINNVQASKSFLNADTGFFGFQVIEKTASSTNNFTIKAGEVIVDGWLVILSADVDYTAQSAFDALTPPTSGTRSDEIYLEVDELEQGVSDDVNIALQTPSGQIESSRREMQRALIKVAVGTTTPASSSTVKRIKLAELTRTTSASILSAQINNTAHTAAAPKTPTNLSLTVGYDEEGVQVTTNLGFAANRPRTTFVRAQWGDVGTGIGTTSTLTISTSRVGSYTTNEWVGHTLIDAIGTAFEIASNTATAVTVVGTPTTGAFVIGPNADVYAVTLVPMLSGSPQWDRAQERTVSLKGVAGSNLYATQMSTEFSGLPAGVTYNVYVASKGTDNDLVSQFSAAVAATTQLATQLTMSPAAAKTVNYGVQVTWAAVTGATNYEVVWNTDNTIADFGNPRHYATNTANTSIHLKGLAGTTINVGVRAIDGTGQVSENAASVEAICGGIAVEKNVKYLGPFWFTKGTADNTKALRLITQVPLESGVEIIRISVYVTSFTCGTPCAGNVNDGKIRVFRTGDESSVANIVPALGLQDQVTSLIIPNAAIINFDAWDSLWDTSAPDTYPITEGFITIAYLEGEAQSNVIAGT